MIIAVQSSSSPDTPRDTQGDVSRHRAWCVGADIDTDALAPGAYMKFGIDEISRHCLQRVRPEFAASVRAGDVLVAGANFGIGSSREQAAAALVHLGVRAVIAPSFSGLYFRNAFNVGLLLLTCADAPRIADGEALALAPREGYIERADGSRLRCENVPGFLLDMADAGGLLNLLKQRYTQNHGASSC